MMKYNIAILNTIVFLIFSNGSTQQILNTNTANTNIITIPDLDNLPRDEFLLLSNFIESSIVVPLETTRECLIGQIDKLKVFNDHIFILDSFQSKGLFEFDMNGKFLRTYGSQGKGPGEYGQPFSFDINENGVYIYDRATKSIMNFDLTGNYLYSSSIGLYSSNFELINKEEYLFDTHLEKQRNWKKTNVSEFSLYKKNKSGKTLWAAFETKKEQLTLSYMSTNNLIESNGRFFFNPYFKNEIYEVKNSEVALFIKFEYENKTIPVGMDENILFEGFNKKLTQNKYAYFHNALGYQVINNMVFFDIYRNEKRTRFVYQIDKDRLFHLKMFDKIGVKEMFGAKSFVYDSYLVSHISPWVLLDNKKHITGSNINKKFNEVIKTTTINNNPIIVFDKIKTY